MRSLLLVIGWLLLVVALCGILGHVMFPSPHPDLRAAMPEHPIRVILYAVLYASPALLAMLFGVIALQRHRDMHSKRLVVASAVTFLVVAILRYCE